MPAARHGGPGNGAEQDHDGRRDHERRRPLGQGGTQQLGHLVPGVTGPQPVPEAGGQARRHDRGQVGVGEGGLADRGREPGSRRDYYRMPDDV